MKTRKKKVVYSNNQVDIPSMEFIQNNLFNMSHPVESIFETTNSSCNTPENLVNYFKTLFGVTSAGTWEVFGKGKVTVAYDPDDNDFKNVANIDQSVGTGGSKYVQSHYHTWSNAHTHTNTFSVTTEYNGTHRHSLLCATEGSAECQGMRQSGNRVAYGIGGPHSNDSTKVSQSSYSINSQYLVGEAGGHSHTATLRGSISEKNISGDTTSYGTGNAGNLQPYIVVYRYRRTS